MAASRAILRIVLDENVLIAGSVFRGTSHLVCGLARSGWLHNSTTEEMLQTVRDKLMGRFKLHEKVAREAVDDIRSFSDVTMAAELPSPICRDADDDRIIGCAASAAANVIVTMDKDLLVLNPLAVPVGRLSEDICWS